MNVRIGLHTLGLAAIIIICALIVSLFPSTAFAAPNAGTGTSAAQTSESLIESTSAPDIDGIELSAEIDAAALSDAPFAVMDFSRAQKGSNRSIEDQYVGYSYYQGSSTNYAVAIATKNYVVVHIPSEASDLCALSTEEDRELLKRYFLALDSKALSGGVTLGTDVPWYFTSDAEVTLSGITYRFNVEASAGKYYVTVLGADGSDVVSNDTSGVYKPTHVDFLSIKTPSEVPIVQEATGLAALGKFLTNVDYSPLWVTLKTTGVAIVFIFILGLAAAYFCLRIPKRAQDIFDTIFTIPMVLPPTVCGFLLLLALGRSSAFGEWLISLGIQLTFSWEATVIAAVVVAFPLMYRSARGAFENLDSDMLDAARTLGWSDRRILFKLMLPLSWSSIAAGTVLAFARALGEFGATLFLAGNYAGITRTVPIAIYFEWMSGNTDVAVFWTVVIIIFSFIVILFINLWSRRTTRYRRKAD